jgi:hypothetical protein
MEQRTHACAHTTCYLCGSPCSVCVTQRGAAGGSQTGAAVARRASCDTGACWRRSGGARGHARGQAHARGGKRTGGSSGFVRSKGRYTRVAVRECGTKQAHADRVARGQVAYVLVTQRVWAVRLVRPAQAQWLSHASQCTRVRESADGGTDSLGGSVGARGGNRWRGMQAHASSGSCGVRRSVWFISGSQEQASGWVLIMIISQRIKQVGLFWF